jgi:hypothetical protein
MPRMKHAHPPLTKDRIEAFAASAALWCLWLIGVIARLAACSRSRRLAREVERLERGVEATFFLAALHRYGPPPRGRHIPRATPRGFRRTAVASRRRLFFRNAQVRARKAGIAARVSALLAALANPEPHIGYFYKRLLRGLRSARLLPTAPPATALTIDAPRAAAITDTS